MGKTTPWWIRQLFRRSSRREEDLEILSSKSAEAIRRSEIVLLLVDGLLGPTEQDAKILEAILEDHKGVILVANKSDLASHEVPAYRKTFQAQVDRNFHFFLDVPVVYVSAKTGQGIPDLFREIQRVSEKLDFRVSTGELNDFFFDVIRQAPSPVYRSTNVKFYYLTQFRFSVRPHSLPLRIIPGGDDSYRRFLTKKIKNHRGLDGIPVRIFCMKSKKGEMRVKPAGSWRTRFGFYLLALASAFSLGNLWRFPFVVGENGGGAFVLLYVFLCLLVGVPILICELILGRLYGPSIIAAMLRLSQGNSLSGKAAPEPGFSFWLKWMGRMAVLICLIVLSYYSVISGWVLHYLTRFMVIGFQENPEFLGSQILLENGWLQFLLSSVHILIAIFVILKIRKRVKTGLAIGCLFSGSWCVF